MRMSALDELLAGLVDFAGLFPPAAMDLESAVRAFAEYRAGANAGRLGAFVVPAAKLVEFEGATRRVGRGTPETPWPVSVLAGDSTEADVERAVRIGRPAGAGPGLRVVSIELKAEGASSVGRASSAVPQHITVAFEIPLSLARDEREAVLLAARACGRIAKARTGGVTPEAIPPPEALAGFIWDCARAGVPFKATAGLHHPIRGERPLTYAADSPRAVMHGFVNVFLSAAAAWALARNGTAGLVDEPPRIVTGILEERDASAFVPEAEAIRWRDVAISKDDIVGARAGLARSFGSCSFEEPMGDLERLGWLARP